MSAAEFPLPTMPEPAPGHGEAIQRHLLAVWRYLRMHGAAAAEADDLVQDAFVVAVQKQMLHREPAVARAFLRATARYLLLRRRRGGRREALLADAVDELWARDCARDDGDGLLQAVRACVQQLDGRARLAVERCYGLQDGDAQSHDAVARELGLERNGLKTLLQRTRQRLRACAERRLRQ